MNTFRPADHHSRPLTRREAHRLEKLLHRRRPVFPHDLPRELAFREEQTGWRRRIDAARRLAPLDNDVVDPLAPHGRWAA